MSTNVLKYRPLLYHGESRAVSLPGEETENMRRSKFSFSAMDMLKTDPATRLVFLQEAQQEKRLSHMLKVLGESISYLEGEIKRRGVATEEEISKLRSEIIVDDSDIQTINKASWVPQNFVDGDWKMAPTLMD